MCGIKPVWASEIEPYPIAVTRSRFPTMKHLGDISKINGAEIEPVDIITFGSPCQDLSVAGKRAGLRHEVNGDEETTRSGLFMEAVRIIREMREATDGKYPRYALWENVPGAFSSNKGEDFRVVLEELIKIAEPSATMPEVPPFGWAYADSYVGDGWSLAYRVFDTQYWPRTPQRRRRIYLVADFGGQRAREILFERKGLRGHLAESPAPRERVTAYVEVGSGATDSEGSEFNTVSILNSWDSQGNHVADGTGSHSFPTLRGCGGAGYQAGYVLAESESTAIIDNIGDQAEYGKMSEVNGTLRAGAQGAIAYCYDARGNGDGETVSTITGDHENRITDYSSVVVEPIVYNGENITNPVNAANPQQGDPCHTLGTDSRNYLVYAIDQQGGKGSANYAEEVMPTLCSDSHGTPHAVAYGISSYDSNAMKSNNPHSGIYKAETSRTLDLNGGNPACNQGGIAIVESKAQLASGADVSGCLMASGYDKLGAQEMFSGDYTVIETQPDMAYSMETFHCTTEEEKVQTLKARDWKDPHVVAYPQQAYSMKVIARNGKALVEQANPICASDYKDPDIVAYGVDCRNMNEYPDLYPTLQAKPNGGQSLNFSGAVRDKYIVRRLTPTECARLQGFSDLWGHPDKKDSFSDEEYGFWLEVRNTHAAINGKAVKEYTKDQMLKWYNKLHSDSAEYKMWGNGIALPPSLYCMQGIEEALRRDTSCQ